METMSAVKLRNKKFDLAISWNWEYDKDFIELIEQIAHRNNISTYLIHPGNIHRVTELVSKNKLYFHVYLDRASDVDDKFEPFAQFSIASIDHKNPHHRILVINPYALMYRAADKATMHLEFLTHDIEVPYTIIISPFRHQPHPELTDEQLAVIGKPFIIKPANTTGGGIGVVLDAKSLNDVLEARRHYQDDKYLLQELIKPIRYGERKAWFRVFYAFGKVFPCWWDDVTHIYEPVTAEDEERFGLSALRFITRKIYRVCRLDFFSTEIATTLNHKFVVVDYVNEMCDMRMKSATPDGVPNEIVEQIITAMIQFVEKQKNRMLPVSVGV
jgi:hypothetical protein